MADYPALLVNQMEGGKVRCLLCAHRCLIRPGQRGLCRVRENRDGKLFSLSYGRLIASHVDPIEKKPLYHFLPGSLSYSIAAAGCNFRCQWCQNADISQITSNNQNGDLRYMFPYMLVAAQPYIGQNTGHSINVSVDDKDPMVAALRIGE